MSRIEETASAVEKLTEILNFKSKIARLKIERLKYLERNYFETLRALKNVIYRLRDKVSLGIAQNLNKSV